MDYKDCKVQYIEYEQTGYFSKQVLDYLNGASSILPFVSHLATDAGLSAAIVARQSYPINRKILLDVLKDQYKDLNTSAEVQSNIQLLSSDQTFTICTAHQPNLLTGYAYFIYKIMHAVVLSKHLSKLHPNYNFVPVYYMGSEDDDLQELGCFKYNGTSYRWETEQTGAVGRMHPQGIDLLLKELFRKLGPPNELTTNIKEILQEAYSKHDTIAAATRYIVNALMGTYGVIVLDPDAQLLKQTFKDIIHNEIIHPKAYELVNETNQALAKQYDIQAFVRPINFFYLEGNIRNRIEATTDGNWRVVNSKIQFSKSEMTNLIENHPERFSPNVILRGLFQESILPNVAFIGGGSELAYWMQLKAVFNHYNVFYPALVLRQSIQFQNPLTYRLQEQLGYDTTTLFKKKDTLIQRYIESVFGAQLQVDNNVINSIQENIEKIVAQAATLDANLVQSVKAAQSKMNDQLQVITQKFKRAAKRKESVHIARIERLKDSIFPNGSLIERFETFLPEYLEYDLDYFETLLQYIRPYGDQFLWIRPYQLR